MRKRKNISIRQKYEMPRRRSKLVTIHHPFSKYLPPPRNTATDIASYLSLFQRLDKKYWGEIRNRQIVQISPIQRYSKAKRRRWIERIDINVLYLLGLLRCVFRGTAAGSARAISTMIQNHLIISDYEHTWNTPSELKRY